MQVLLISPDGRVRRRVEVEGIDDHVYREVSDMLYRSLVSKPRQAYKLVANAMRYAIELCPEANPADLWVHLIYFEFRNRLGRSDQSWKRVSGDAFEHLIISVYNSRLRPYGIRMRRPRPDDAKRLRLLDYGIGSAKTDIILETDAQATFGVLHCKASIAERLADDAPASMHLLQNGYWSGVATMDAKMFPPPHGDGVVRGELGTTRTNDKRNYFEVAGQFSGCYSFNSRTPPSPATTQSGIRINTLSFSDPQPDQLAEAIITAKPS